MWFFYLCGGLIIIAFLGICAEGRQMRARARLPEVDWCVTARELDT